MAEKGKERSWLGRAWDMAAQTMTVSSPSILVGVAAIRNKNIQESVRDISASLASTVASGVDFIRNTWRGGIGALGPGDQQYAPSVEQSLRDRYDRNVKPFLSEAPKFTFAAANGWEISAGTKYNGRQISEGQKIDSVTAIFIRNQNGTIEVLDRDDKRWARIMAPYTAAQLATLGIGGLGAVGKAGSVARIAGAISVADQFGAVAQIVDPLANDLILSPAKINGFARDLYRLSQNPGQSLSAKTLSNMINSALYDVSYREGSMAGQYYVPSLRAGQLPWKRLEEMSQGFISDAQYRDTPFESFSSQNKRTNTSMNLDEGLRQNPFFLASYYKLADKALSGQVMTGQEIMMLRFSMNVQRRQDDKTGISSYDKGFMSLNPSLFTQQNIQSTYHQTVEAVRGQVSAELNAKKATPSFSGAAQSKPHAQGNSIEDIIKAAESLQNQMRAEYTDTELRNFVRQNLVIQDRHAERIQSQELEQARMMGFNPGMPLIAGP